MADDQLPESVGVYANYKLRNVHIKSQMREQSHKRALTPTDEQNEILIQRGNSSGTEWECRMIIGTTFRLMWMNTARYALWQNIITLNPRVWLGLAHELGL